LAGAASGGLGSGYPGCAAPVAYVMNGLLLLPGDRIGIMCRPAPLLASIGFRVSAVVEMSDGSQSLSQWSVTNLTSGVYQYVPIAAGRLLSVTVTSTDTIVQRAQFVECSLQRGMAVGAAPVFCFISCWVSGGQSASWSWSGSVVVPAAVLALRKWVGADPVAGSNFVVDVAFDGVWLVDQIRFVLTTSAAVADRFPQLMVADAGGDLEVLGGTSKQTASTVQYHRWWFYGKHATLLGGFSDNPLPVVLFCNRIRFQTAVYGLDASNEVTDVYVDMLPYTGRI